MGGYRITRSTLTRFFIIHFCLPIIMVSLVGLHVFTLHKTGRQNPTNLLRKYNLSPFQPFFVIKDLSVWLLIFIIFEILVFLSPYLLGDPENFSMANIITTPEHIVPEWYFLFAYAILRCIPRKGLGVIAILTSVFIILAPMFIILQKNLTHRNRKRFNHHI